MRLEISDFPIQTKIPVQWGDMDAAKHVNNLIYLRWTETARIAYFQKMGMDVSFESGEAGPILGWQDCKYIFPMTFPDTAIVGVKLHEILEDRFTVQCAVFSEKHKRIAAIAHNTIIPYNYKTLQKINMPQLWIDRLI